MYTFYDKDIIKIDEIENRIHMYRLSRYRIVSIDTEHDI